MLMFSPQPVGVADQRSPHGPNLKVGTDELFGCFDWRTVWPNLMRDTMEVSGVGPSQSDRSQMKSFK